MKDFAMILGFMSWLYCGSQLVAGLSAIEDPAVREGFLWIGGSVMGLLIWVGLAIESKIQKEGS